MIAGFASSWMAVLLMALGGGSVSRDLVALVDAEDYFKAHSIEVKAEALLEMAAKEPEDAKGQVVQLLALRWLGEHPDQANKVKNARAAVGQIAAGKKAQDRLGFARDYAQRTLALLDGKPAAKPAAIPANSVAREALQWFPDSATLFGAYDLRASGEFALMDESRVRSFLLKMMVRPQDKEEFYKFVDGTGNMRLDRLSFAYTHDPQDNSKGRIYLRFTGLADRKALTDLIKKGLQEAKVEFKKGPKGGLMTVISSEKHPPAYALIGDTEMLMCGYQVNENAREVLEEALDVQAGKKDSILKGRYADKLKQVPPGAVGVIMGDVPEYLRQEFVRGGSPLKAIPKSIAAFMTRTKTIKIDCHATMADADDAKAFAENVAELKKMAMDNLKQLPAQFKLTLEQIKVLTKALEGIKVQAKDDKVTGGVEFTQKMVAVAQDVAQKGMELLLESTPASRPIPKPKETKEVEKKEDK